MRRRVDVYKACATPNTERNRESVANLRRTRSRREWIPGSPPKRDICRFESDRSHQRSEGIRNPATPSKRGDVGSNPTGPTTPSKFIRLNDALVWRRHAVRIRARAPLSRCGVGVTRVLWEHLSSVRFRASRPSTRRSETDITRASEARDPRSIRGVGTNDPGSSNGKALVFEAGYPRSNRGPGAKSRVAN
jgi:hypothetical protein